MASERKTHDWEAIEREYRAGILSVHQIAARYGCVEGSIRYRATKFAWERDLSDQVRKSARVELLRKASRAKGLVTEEEIIADGAAQIMDVVQQHRTRLSQVGEAAEQLLSTALKAAQSAKTLDAARDAASVVESLGRTLARLIPLERQAFNLDEKGIGESSLESLIVAANKLVKPNA